MQRLLLPIALVALLLSAACGQGGAATGAATTGAAPTAAAGGAATTAPAAASTLPAAATTLQPSAEMTAAEQSATQVASPIDTPAATSGAQAAATAAPAATSAAGAATAAPASGTGTPGAQTTASLPQQILDRGTIVIGVKYDVPTFGYLNPTTNQLEGFDVDLGKAIARELLGDESKAEFTQAKSADRIPFLENGQVDLVLSTMTANEERAEQIDFTDAYYIAGQSLLVPASSEITGVADLGGKTVCSVSGSTSEKNIREKAPEANVVLFGTYSECVQTMDTGRAEAVTTDDIILLGFVKQSPDKYKVVGGQFTIEPYAGGVAKGNTELLQAVNGAIQKIKDSGEWQEIYERNLPGAEVPDEPPPADWREVYEMQPSGA